MTYPTEVNQICEKDRTGSLGKSSWRPDPVKRKESNQKKGIW